MRQSILPVILFVIGIAIGLTSCKKEHDRSAEIIICPDQTQIPVRILGQSGSDLLSATAMSGSQLPITFTTENTPTQLKYTIGNIPKTDTFYITLPPPNQSGNRSFYIQLSANDIDTIFVQRSLSSSKPYSISSFTYNGKSYEAIDLFHGRGIQGYEVRKN